MRQDLVHCSGPILEIYKALPQPLSETKERANSCLVNAAERDVGVVDGLTSDHLVMCLFQVPPSRFRGRFCPLNSQKHVTVPAPGSKFDASRSQKDERATE